MINWFVNLFRKKIEKHIKRKNVIAILSEDRCGKDTLAEYIVEHLDREFGIKNNREKELFNFGQDIKEEYAKLSGCSLEEIDDCKNNIKKCKYHKNYGNCRDSIITYSLIKKAEYGESYFTNMTINRINKSKADLIVISDLRFLIEFKLLKYNFNVNVIKVISDLDSCGKNNKKYDTEDIIYDSVIHIHKVEEMSVKNFTNMLNKKEIEKMLDFNTYT